MKKRSLGTRIPVWVLILCLIAPLLPGTVPAREEWGLFFGQLHSHSSLSSGERSVEALFQQAALSPGLDFFAVTDHSHSLDGGEQALLGTDAGAVSAGWARGRAAAAAVTNGEFVGLYGFELSWQQEKQLGHAVVLATPGFVTREKYPQHSTALPDFYDDLAGCPDAIGIFCHPGAMYGSFQNLAHASDHRNSALSLLEIGSGSDGLFYYDLALSQGWFTAPAGPEGSRTAVLARSLTEEDLYDALRNRRVYATEDPDLGITYTLNGHILGSRLARRQVGELAELRVSLRDTGETGSTVLQVIVENGQVAAACTLPDASGEVRFTLPATHPYYYIKVIQADGDVAVTAPVWIDQTEEAGIEAFSCGTALPVEGRQTELILELHNRESEALTVENISLSLDGKPFSTARPNLTVTPGEIRQYRVSFVPPAPGKITLSAKVTACLGSAPRSYEAELILIVRPPELVSGVVIDGAHGNAGLRELAEFSVLAAESGRQVQTVTTWDTAPADSADLLVVTAPGSSFAPEFLDMAAEFVRQGGSVVVCGQSDSADPRFHSARELNRLLEALGSTLRLGDNEVRDTKENMGLETDLALGNFEKSSHWYVPELEDQVFRLSRSCTVSGGHCLITGNATTISRDTDGDGGAGNTAVVLAWESGSGGGSILVSGGLFLTDDFLKEPESVWKAPFANRTLTQRLLGIHEEVLSLSPISQLRRGTQGRQYRIRGYLTAGNDDPGTTLGDLLYLQDASGGIALADVMETGLAVGTAVEVTGILSLRGKEPLLQVLTLDQEDAPPYFHTPVTGSYSRIMDNSLHGGQLVQVEGEVVCVSRDQGQLTEFLLRSPEGRYATVTVDSHIRSLSTGDNPLADRVRSGREVRAIGILSQKEDGTAAIRVRNCDEVTLLSYWPYSDTPYADPTNPPTGDGIGLLLVILFLSGAALTLLKRKRS